MLAGEVGRMITFEHRLVLAQALLFLVYDFTQFLGKDMRPLDHGLIKKHNIRLGNCADCELTVARVANFPHDEDIKWYIKAFRDLGRHNYAAAGQAQDNVEVNPFGPQIVAELGPSILARGECHAPPYAADPTATSARWLSQNRLLHCYISVKA